MFKSLKNTNNDNHYTLFPIKHQQVWEMYKKAEASIWRVEEIDFGNDHFDQLSENEREFVGKILAFFAASDGIVIENLAVNFLREIDVAEIRAFYSLQLFIETVHSETYSVLIETYISDLQKKNELFNAITHVPCVKKKADWSLRWISSKNASFAERLVAFAAVEGVFFSGAFCAIFWLRDRGLLPGLGFSNELISRDEALHTEFAVLLYSMLKEPLSHETVKCIICDAVAIEKEFITDAVPCAMIGMNADLMKQYIEFVADRLLVQLGVHAVYNASNPFSFAELSSMQSKTSFFEKKVSDYALANLNEGTDSSDGLNLDTDF